MGSYTSPTPDTWVTARIITGGLWAWILTIPPTWVRGRRRPSAGGFGDTAVLPATAQTCSSSRGIRLTRAAFGWAAKQLSGYKLARPGPVSRLTTGRLRIGSVSTIVTPIWAV